MIDIITGVLSTLAASGAGTLGYFYRKFDKRLTQVEMCTTMNKLQTAKKMDREQVKEVVQDKLEPVHVLLVELKDDTRLGNGRWLLFHTRDIRLRILL